jgi:hypothetical protein
VYLRKITSALMICGHLAAVSCCNFVTHGIFVQWLYPEPPEAPCYVHLISKHDTLKTGGFAQILVSAILSKCVPTCSDMSYDVIRVLANWLVAGWPTVRGWTDGFGGLVVSILATGTRVRGFKPGHPKNPQYVFLPRGSKIICPMSQLCDM